VGNITEVDFEVKLFEGLDGLRRIINDVLHTSSVDNTSVPAHHLLLWIQTNKQ
jgi:hypothetical protein